MLQRAESRRFASALLCLGLVAATGLLPACQKSGDAAADAAFKEAAGKDVELRRDGDTLAIEAGDAEFKVATARGGGSVALPADFPGDVFLPAQHTVNSAMDMAGMKMVNLTSPAPRAAVAADVETAMQARGWKREMAMQADGSSTLIYAKEKRQAVYQIMQADGGGTQLAIRVGGE